MQPPAELLIRPPANVVERRACRMLLPDATAPSRKASLLVAVWGPEQRIVGAAALGLDPRPEMRARWRTDLRVIAPFRRRGIGRALMEQAAARAARHGVDALYAWEWVEPESEAARAWAALGFEPAQQKVEFEIDLATSTAKILTPMYEQIVEHGWIPANARIIPLSEADHDAVAALHVEYLGGSRRVLMPLLNGTAPDRFDPKYSRVLTVDGQAVGFTLGRVVPGGVCEIDSNVLHPTVRLGWANLWLKYEAAQCLLADGIHTIRYFTMEQHTDTRRLSRQAGSRVIRTMVQMRRALPAAPAPAQPPPRAGGSGAGA